MRKKSGLTHNQFLVLLGLGAVTILILGVTLMFAFLEIENPVVVPTPVSIGSSLSNNVVATPTSLFPTYVYLPTFTEIPSATSFVLHLNTPAPAASQYPQGSTTPSSSPSANCSQALAYAASLHQYNLTYMQLL